MRFAPSILIRLLSPRSSLSKEAWLSRSELVRLATRLILEGNDLCLRCHNGAGNQASLFQRLDPGEQCFDVRHQFRPSRRAW